VGRRELTQHGRWMAAVLACGPSVFLSHESAAALWGVRAVRRTLVEVSVPAPAAPRRPGIRVHRRHGLQPGDIVTHQCIPCTSPIRTLIDLATTLPAKQLERAVNESDKLDLVDPESLRAALEDRKGGPGVRVLRKLLDRHTFRLTDSELERYFLPIVRRAGLPVVCATTAPRPSRPPTAVAIRSTPPPDSPRFASLTTRFASSRLRSSAP
jgi:hypothetical protein